MNHSKRHTPLSRALPHVYWSSAALLLASVIALPAGTASIFNVKDYGATGRKEDDARPAIQKAIDAAAAFGGGTVFLPAGLYTSGTLHLRSHIRFEMAAGATLFAAPDPKAYDYGTIASKAALFFGQDLEDISFEGEGIVDGQARYVWQADDFERDFQHKTWMQSLGKSLMRSVPQKSSVYPHLVWLGGCRNVRVSGLTFLHSPSWTFALYDCRHATFNGLYIYTSLKEAVWADGIDLDGCQDVSIANCAIETGDDCVALVSNDAWGPPLPCERICVTNCRLSSASAGIKFSEGNHAGVSDIHVTHSLFNNVNRAVAFLTAYGGSISNVTFSDLTINCSRFDWFWAGEGQPFRCGNFRLSELNSTSPKTNDVSPGLICQLTFSNIVAHAKGPSFFYGNPDCWLQAIDFEHVRLFISSDPTAPFDKTEHALDFRRVVNLTLKDLEVVWEGPPLESWKSALNLQEIHGLDLDGFSAAPPCRQSAAPVIALQQVSGVTLRHAKATEGTDNFIRIGGPGSHDIRFEDNDLSRARLACRLANDVPSSAVTGLAQAPH
jgi:hypothetical protein